MTMLRRYRVLIIASHPVQYVAPLFRLMADHPQLDLQVAYCSLQGAEAGHDPEFGVEVTWDIPLLEGYSWVSVPNRSPNPGLGKFWGLLNPGLWQVIRQEPWDAIVIYTGYAYASFWLALLAVKLNRIPVIFNTDATSLAARSGPSWKERVKAWVLPRIFELADVAIGGSAAGKEFLLSLGLPLERVAVTPFVVDNDWWTNQIAQVNRTEVRATWQIPETAPVVLFCAKLQSWKRPLDVLQAFAEANVPDTFLVFAGAGPLQAELEQTAQDLGVGDRVRFLGFVNQSRLPATYGAADLFVLPSGYDPCPVVVCEAMLCGCPVVISDEIRGRFDIVHPNHTGFIYPCGDIPALAAILGGILTDRPKLEQMGRIAQQRMETWSPQDNVESLVQAIDQAVHLKRTRNDT
ncbi:MAG: glycosyltransferase [Leptolyngbyaceae cyanobacterium bins.59]|nr:glycosyltransferase [Leptolyngbyaceae cyanobacterium bins.59]